MKHTPGPWYAVEHKIFKDIKDRRYTVAEASDWSEETEFNSSLIAAAPEMLEALKNILALLNGEMGSNWAEHYQADYDVLMNAINKAEGKI